MALLSKTQILSATDRRYETVAVPEWGGEVRVQSLTGKERDDFEASLTGPKGKSNYKNARARLIARCAVDEDGNLIFTNRLDVEDLGDKSVAALQRLFNACQRLNGLTDEDVEELTEDFEKAPVELSSSDSQVTSEE